MDNTYSPQAVEGQAQNFWDEHQSFKVSEDLSKEKFYCLSMFPYPSGQLHMGHVRNYSIGDVIARYQRMQGKNVLQPMGWDAFGLPAENAAIKHNIAPAKWTEENIEVMREQFKSLGFAYDWHREFRTCDPAYYRWEQWLFVKLFKKGLVYRKNSMVNWDPVDQTVLANEQVVNGCGWRSGAPIERREISQWFIKITAYADELLDSLEGLENWPDQVRTMQKNWIGRSEGVEIEFAVAENGHPLRVFTTRADTLLGCTYLAIAPQHPLAKKAAESDESLANFISQCDKVKVAEADMATMEKLGHATPFHAIHPITGEELPIWVANFVLMDYGQGAVMSVPGHDERDHEFATKYHLQIKQVIKSADDSDTTQWDVQASAYMDYGLTINSGEFDNLDSNTAIEKIAEYLIEHNKGKKEVHYRLRDWGVSRQRYWGTPIPMILCEHCGDVPVPEEELPVILPVNVSFDESLNPLKSDSQYYKIKCPECGKKAQRETDTFDTFMESSWYYARFASFNQNKAMLDDRAKYWTPVDQYVGGVEHAVMHLLYARFFHKLLRDEGLINSDEPFSRLLTQGMVLKDGAKMSKSKGNVVDPKALIDAYGADTVRLFSIFASPPEQSLEWSDSGVAGANRYLKRLWQFAYTYRNIGEKKDLDWADAPDSIKDARRQIHMALKQASFDYQRTQLNTIISACMKMLNTLEELTGKNNNILYTEHCVHEGLSILLRVLAPIAPHITHVIWQDLGFGEDILQSKWPKVANDALKAENMELIVQVNGKLRAKINVAVDASKEDIEHTALDNESVQKFLDGNHAKKVIYVPGRLVNIVV